MLDTIRKKSREGPMRLLSSAVLVVAAVLGAIATSCQAAGVIIGPLCLDGVASTSHPELATDTATGRWTPHEYRLTGANGRLLVFGKPIPEAVALETCADTEKRVALLGLKPILAGRLSALKLTAAIFAGAPKNRVQIDKDAFSATLVSVERGTHPLLGGTIDFSGSKAWIGTTARVLSQSDGIEGEVSVEVWNRTIQGVLVALPGGSEYRANLRPRDAGNETVRLDLASGVARLWGGDLVGTPSVARQADWALTSVAAQDIKATAATVQVMASGGAADLTLAGIKGTAGSFDIPTNSLSWHFQNVDLSIASLTSSASQSPEALTASTATLRNASIKAVTGSLATTSGEFLRGPVTLDSTLLTPATIKATSAWKQPTSDALSPVFADKVVQLLQFAVDGGRDSPSTTVQMDTEGISIGGIGVARSLHLASGSAPAALEVVLPVEIKVPATGGSVKVTNHNQEVLLTGRLDKLLLSGQIVIPLTALDKTRLEVPKDKFQLSMGLAVAVSPFLAGGKPSFGDSALAFSNRTDLVVGKLSSGDVLARTDIFLLANPVLQVGDNAAPSSLAADLKADGGAVLLYDMAGGKMILAQAKLRIPNASFGLAGPAPHILDVAGDQITEPKVSLDEMLIEVDVIPPSRVATGHLKNLQVAASDFKRVRQSGEAKGPTYSGHLKAPFQVNAVTAAQVVLSDKIVLQQVEVSGVKLDLDSANADFGDGTSITGGSIALAIDKVAEVKQDDRIHRVWMNGHLAVSGNASLHASDFALNGNVPVSLTMTVSGPEESLSGSGSMSVGAFSGNARSPLHIGFKCANGTDLEVPLEYNFASGGGALTATFDHGDLAANGVIAPMGVDAHTVGVGHGCDGPKKKFVVVPAQHGWTEGICTQLWPPKAWSCRWEWSTPEISLGYHIRLDIQFANLAIGMTNPRMFVRKGRTAYCNVGVVQTVAPLIVGGFSPQIDTPFGGDGEKLVNAIIAANFEAPQTMVTSSIVAGAGWLVSSVGTPLGNLLCIGKPL
ncbi:hypothetical protein [Ralstonia solanacearum]|uniref:hypothetical protein n=1 Tax=Ralstonia solanacearum TaxID=305 RepID=UPI00030DBEFC|nr:hypothetical protein [Ralstonia solanacearum]